MANKHIETLAGLILDDRTALSLQEVSQACAVKMEWILALVQEGIVEASGDDPKDWSFSVTSLRRIRLAYRLERDLEINLAGVGLAIELLEEITVLRMQLQALSSHRETS